MTPLQNLYYALGELAYAVANADGVVQKAERQKFHDMVAEQLDGDNCGFDLSLMIFQILDKSKLSTAEAYEKAFIQLQSNSHCLNAELKSTFIQVLENIAAAYPPVTMEENNLIEKFKVDLACLDNQTIR